MKIRIQDNFIRLRLSIAELESLTKQQSIEMITSLGFPFLKTQITCDSPHAHIQFDNNVLKIDAPVHLFRELMDSDEEGFDFTQSVSDDIQLIVSIQKDFKCIGREEASNHGLFPNKKSNSDAC